MRTTVVLDDDLVKRAKQRASELRTTLSEVINQALREAVSRPLPQAPDFQMVTYGVVSARAHHEPKDFTAALEDEEAPAR